MILSFLQHARESLCRAVVLSPALLVIAASAAAAISTEAMSDTTGQYPDSLLHSLPVALPEGHCSWDTSEYIPPDGYLFVFATIADSHIRLNTSDDIRYLKALSISSELLAHYVDCINTHTPSVDFVIHLGDVTDLALPAEFAAARSILDSLSCPLYPVVGNHDNFQSDNKQGWKDFAGLDSTMYSFDFLGYHFVVIDCTLDPYQPPYVDCDSVVRSWVAQDLTAHSNTPSFILSHYNMWERGWNAKFDTTQSYAEYEGMLELRQVLEQAGNVLGVLNGHVHANRVEEHNGIHYADISATLVGPPSIRYFYVYPESIVVSYAYISDENLFNHVVSLCPRCTSCFDPLQVCEFIDGSDSDKHFTMHHTWDVWASANRFPEDPTASFSLKIIADQDGHIRAVITSDLHVPVDISLYDVLGRQIDRSACWKRDTELAVDLYQSLPRVRAVVDGIYFLRVRHGEEFRTRKVLLRAN